MSRIGKKPIRVREGVTVTVDGQLVRVKGPKGELQRTLHPHVSVVQEGDGTYAVKIPDGNDQNDRALWGLSQRLITNMIEGVTNGYLKKLELVGVGFKASVSGQTLTLNIGFSHPVVVPLPKGITATVEKNTFLTITGIDKELLGNTVAKIRALRKPEPYKGKGIKYEGEVIRRKLGKAAKAAGAAGGAA